MTYQFDLTFSNCSSRNVQLTSKDSSKMDFIVGSRFRASNCSRIELRKDKIVFDPQDASQDVNMTVYFEVTASGTDVVSFDLQHCSKLDYVLDEDVEKEVGGGTFSVRLS